jgi:hypothetical protein
MDRDNFTDTFTGPYEGCLHCVVTARTSVTGDLGFPEQQRYIEKVEELEAYQQQQHYKYVQEVPESTTPPEFKSPIKDQNNVREGGFAHFEARLEPVGDSTLQVEWLKDGRPVEASAYKLPQVLSVIILLCEIFAHVKNYGRCTLH